MKIITAMNNPELNEQTSWGGIVLTPNTGVATNTNLPIPERTNPSTTKVPTPPIPKIATLALASLAIASVPINSSVRENACTIKTSLSLSDSKVI